MITFANSLDPDQAQQNVGPEWIQTDNAMVFLKEFFEKVNFEKKKHSRRQKNMKIA